MKKFLIIILSLVLLSSCGQENERGMQSYKGSVYKKDTLFYRPKYLMSIDTVYQLYVTTLKNGKTYRVRVSRETYDSTMQYERYDITERIENLE